MHNRAVPGAAAVRRASPAALCDITNTSLAGHPGHVATAKHLIGTVAGPYEVVKAPSLPPVHQNSFGGGHGYPKLPAAAASVLGQAPLHQDVMDEAGPMDEDPQNVAEYVSDIYHNLRRDESSFMARPNYMDDQQDINAKMRAILIDWLVEVHMKYKLKTETLFLTVSLIDRYLDKKKQVSRKRLQLCGVTAMLIAAKYEEIYPPEVRDFVYITDNAYTKDDILMMEVSILTTLKFSICCPTVAPFLEQYQRANGCSEVHQHLMQYVLELTLPDLKMIQYTPSHLAASAALLTNKLLKVQPPWPAAMVSQTNTTEPMVKACAREMCGLIEAAERSPLQAVRRKFSQAKFNGVAKIAF